MRRRAAVGSLGPGDAGPRPERPRAQPQATNQFGCSPSGIRVSAPRAGRSRRSDNGPVACRAGVGDTGRPCPVECHGSGMNPLRSLCPRTVSAEPRSPRRDSRSARLWAGARPRAGWARNISSRSATPGGLAGAAAAAREPQRPRGSLSAGCLAAPAGSAFPCARDWPGPPAPAGYAGR